MNHITTRFTYNDLRSLESAKNWVGAILHMEARWNNVNITNWNVMPTCDGFHLLNVDYETHPH